MKGLFRKELNVWGFNTTMICLLNTRHKTEIREDGDGLSLSETDRCTIREDESRPLTYYIIKKRWLRKIGNFTLVRLLHKRIKKNY